MREIKFRAWNGEVMISPDYIDRDGYAHWKENSIPERTDKIMLWTGLLDKQGKEIYEGDILGGMWEYGYISWCEKCKTFQYFADYNGGCQRCSGDTSWEEIVEENGKLEVIGNIYENPELLEKENG